MLLRLKVLMLLGRIQINFGCAKDVLESSCCIFLLQREDFPLKRDTFQKSNTSDDSLVDDVFKDSGIAVVM